MLTMKVQLIGTPWNREIQSLLQNLNTCACYAAKNMKKLDTLDTTEVDRLLKNVNEALERFNSLPHILSDDPEGGFGKSEEKQD